MIEARPAKEQREKDLNKLFNMAIDKAEEIRDSFPGKEIRIVINGDIDMWIEGDCVTKHEISYFLPD